MLKSKKSVINIIFLQLLFVLLLLLVIFEFVLTLILPTLSAIVVTMFVSVYAVYCCGII